MGTTTIGGCYDVKSGGQTNHPTNLLSECGNVNDLFETSML